MKIITKKQSERGFTLIEVMIVVTLLAVGILAAASMQINAMQGNATAKRQTEASQLLANVSEEINRMPYADAVEGVTEQTLHNYTITTTMGPVSTFSGATARKVTAAVTWTDGAGPSKTINYTFLKIPPLL